VIVNPLFGFNNQNVILTCYQASPTFVDFSSACTFGTNPITTNGVNPATSSLTIQTYKYTPTTTETTPRFFPSGKVPPLILGLLSLAALASLAFGNKRRGRQGQWGINWLGVRVVALSVILALDLVLAISCRAPTLVTSGTVPGTYTIEIQGQLQSNTNVNRYAKLLLSVTQTVPTS
jgi:hypothetical protein